jgi:hypothetical protein
MARQLESIQEEMTKIAMAGYQDGGYGGMMHACQKVQMTTCGCDGQY